MATTTKNKPDYDPVEEALDIGHKLGVEQERKRQQPKIEAARRGGQRRGRAEGSKAIEQDRRERAAKADARREVTRRRREEELASARRGAFASGAAKAKRDAAGEAQRATAPSPRRSSGGSGAAVARNLTRSAPVTAPTFSATGGGGLSRETSARLIILTIGISTVAVIAYNARHKAPAKHTQKVGNDIIAVPENLRELGGVFVAGTVALVVNEVSPGLGLALALIMGIEVVRITFLGKNGLFAGLGTGLFAKTYGNAGLPADPNAPLSVPQQPGGPTGTTKSPQKPGTPGHPTSGGVHIPGTGITRS